MSTNFFLAGHRYDGDPECHIGKRSAAGMYCWDCELTLCKGGEARIHAGEAEWEPCCPRCGQVCAPREPGVWRGPVAVELGFAEPETERPRGVQGAASFTWAMEPGRLGVYLREHASEPAVEDEYGRLLTGEKFWQMIQANCPIQFTCSIGTVFS
jgi:hypothetical protein